AALTRQTVEDLWSEYREELAAMDVGPLGRIATLIWDGRFSLVTALLAGFGRAAAEVGAVLIVGGNIDGFTRTMTTAIALETSQGDLPLGRPRAGGVHASRHRVPAADDAAPQRRGQYPLRARRRRRAARAPRRPRA